MPNLEPVVLEGRGYSLRHIGPMAILLPDPPVPITGVTVLNQPAMVGRELPMTNNPNSPDMVSGSWTGRLQDAGEFTLQFPNKEASDGEPWRDRFASDGKNQWIEIHNDAYLEACCCIEKVDSKRDQIVISGHDGWFQIKGAYERDWIVTQSPRDVIERGTQVWVADTSDDFSFDGTTSPKPQWAKTGTGSAIIGDGGAVYLTITPAPSTNQLFLTGPAVSCAYNTSTWSATTDIIRQDRGVNTDPTVDPSLQSAFGFFVNEADGHSYGIAMWANLAQLYANGSVVAQVPLNNVAVSWNLLLESDGEWITAYVNGQFLAGVRRATAYTDSLQAQLVLTPTTTNGGQSVVSDILLEHQAPFLMRGADKGDYALPSTSNFVVGEVSTYPFGGLHARYFNDADLQSDPFRLIKIQHPSRTLLYGATTSSEYANQEDPNIPGATPGAGPTTPGHNPQPGAASTNWSAQWFGAIWLPLSQGDVGLVIQTPSGAPTAVRVWIGKTTFGTELVDQWNWQDGGNFNFTVSDLAGTLGYDGGTVVRDGWYPIKIQYAVDAPTDFGTGPAFYLTSAPVTYTDPGGFTYQAGAQHTGVQSSSLSPLGCIDQRFQGISHFDMVNQTAQGSGYQMALEPKSLESGLFPGVLAPRFREGEDFDVVLEPDDYARTEGLLNYGNLLDATDNCTSLQGNGAGFQNGNTGQLQARIYDHTHLEAALFDIQGWQDFSDSAFSALLQALLNSQLGLRLDPWQVITGDPVGRPRLAYAWPLPSTLAQMRWRPGDGMRVYARDVNIEDRVPRQLLLVSRQIAPNGSTGTQVSFAARPRSATHILKQSIFQATRWQRNYQRQMVTLPGSYQDRVPIARATTSGSNFSMVALQPGDEVVRASVRLNYNLAVNAPSGKAIGVIVNGVDVTSLLKGPWTTFPVVLDISSVVAPDAYNRVSVQLHNQGSGSAYLSWQLLVDVLR